MGFLIFRSAAGVEQRTRSERLFMSSRRLSTQAMTAACAPQKPESRLEGLNCQLNLLVQQASSLRKTELLYRKAFIRRCYNLQTAEAEVDLLGDEVDALLGLLEKIYIVLDYYSPVLQYYCGIMDILKLVKKELFGGATVKSHK